MREGKWENKPKKSKKDKERDSNSNSNQCITHQVNEYLQKKIFQK